MASDELHRTVAAKTVPTDPSTAEGTARSSGTSVPQVPGYEVLAELGRGGMGVVYHAKQVKLNRDVALKMVLGADRAGPKEVIRFLAEAEAVAAVRHPNVVQVYDYGESDGRPFMALEHLSGGTLAARLAGCGRLDAADAVDVLMKLAAGVEAAHAQGIVHRDLKPGNVLFDDAGEPKITDFGLAKRDSNSDLTKSNTVMGTPAYMAPEQAKGESKFVGPTADVWALGGILYQCLTGITPFRGDDAWSILHNVLTADPVPPRKLVAAIPTDLEQVCLKCLRKEPHERYATAEAFAADLENVRTGRPVSARPVGMLERSRKWVRRNPLPAAFGGAFLVVLGGLIVSLAIQVRSAERRAETEASLRKNEEVARKDAERLATENAALANAERDRRLEADLAKAGAKAELGRANQVTDFLTSLFQSSDPLDIFGENLFPRNWKEEQKLTARDFLDRATVRFKSSLTDQPLVRARLLAALGASYSNIGLYDQAKPLLVEALWIRAGRLPADDPDVSQSEMDLGKFDLDQGDSPGAEARFRRVLAAREKSGLTPVERARYEFHIAYAMCLSFKPESIPLFRKVIATRTEHLGPDHPHTVFAKMGIVACMTDQFRNVLEVPILVNQITESLARQSDNRFRTIGQGIALYQQGLVQLFTSRIIPNDALQRAAIARAAVLFRKAIEVSETTLPKDHLYVTFYRWTLAQCLADIDDVAALREYAETDRAIQSGVGYAHPRALLFAESYADFLMTHGKSKDVPPLLELLRTANRARFGAENAWRPFLLAMQAQFARRRGQPAEATASTRELHRCLTTGPVIWSRYLLQRLFDLQWDLIRRNEFALASDLAVAMQPVVESRAADDPSEVVLGRFLRAVLKGSQSGWAEVADEIERICKQVDVVRQVFGAEWEVRIFDYGFLIAKLRGDWPRAEGYARKALSVAQSVNLYGDVIDMNFAIAQTLLERNRGRDAIAYIEKAIAVTRQNQTNSANEGNRTVILAAVHLLNGDLSSYKTVLKRLIARRIETKDAAFDPYIAWIGALHPVGIAEPAVLIAAREQPDSGAANLLALRRGETLYNRSNRFFLALSPNPINRILVAYDLFQTGYRGAADHLLRSVEAMIVRDTPSAERPYAAIATGWTVRIQAQFLAAELRTKMASAELAPPPRPVSK